MVLTNPNIGLIGCGDIAELRYLDQVKGIEEAGEATFRAVCDVEQTRVDTVADRYDVPVTYTDYEDLLADETIDIVVNTTPQQLHGEINRAVADAGKHLFSEKPIALDVDTAQEIIDIADTRDVTLAVAPADILQPGNQYAKGLIDAGGIGEISLAMAQGSHEGAGYHKANYDPSWFYMKEHGGAIYDVGIYAIQRLVYFFGGVNRVTAFSGIKHPTRYVGYFDDEHEFVEQTVEATGPDNTVLLLDFGDNLFGVIAATYNVMAHAGPKYQIYGTKGTLGIRYTGDGYEPQLYLDNDEVRGWIEEPLPLRPNASLATEQTPRGFDRVGFSMALAPNWSEGTIGGVDHVVHCLQEDVDPVIDGQLAMHCLDVIETTLEAAETGRTVEVATTWEST